MLPEGAGKRLGSRFVRGGSPQCKGPPSDFHCRRQMAPKRTYQHRQKLANRLAQGKARAGILCAADTFAPPRFEQLEIWRRRKRQSSDQQKSGADQAGPSFTTRSPQESRSFRNGRSSWTPAGRCIPKSNLMAELGKNGRRTAAEGYTRRTAMIFCWCSCHHRGQNGLAQGRRRIYLHRVGRSPASILTSSRYRERAAL